MTTETLLADSNVNTLWDVYDYTKTTTQGDGNTTECDSGDDNKHQEYGIADSAKTWDEITSIKLTLHSSTEDDAKDWTCFLTVEAADTTDQLITAGATGTLTTDTYTWAGSWTDGTGISVTIDPGSISGGDAPMKIDYLEIELTGTESAGGGITPHAVNYRRRRTA